MRNRIQSSALPALVCLILSFLMLLPVGAAPAMAKGGAEAIAISPDGTRLFVARTAIHTYSSDSAVSVVDTSTLRLAATLQPMGPHGSASPWANALFSTMALSPDGSRLFVSRIGAIDLLNPADNQLSGTVKTGSMPLSMAVSPDGQRLYLAGPDAGLHVIDAATATPLTTVNLHHLIWRVVASPDGHRLYAMGPGGSGPSNSLVPSSSLQVLDAGTLQVVNQLDPGRTIDGAALSPDGKRLYLTTRLASPKVWDSHLDVYDAATLQLLASATIADRKYDFGQQPVISPNGKRIYLTMMNSTDLIRVIDADTLQVIGTLKASQAAEAPSQVMAVSPDGNRLYMASFTGNTVWVIDSDSLSTQARIDLRTVPTSAP